MSVTPINHTSPTEIIKNLYITHDKLKNGFFSTNPLTTSTYIHIYPPNFQDRTHRHNRSYYKIHNPIYAHMCAPCAMHACFSQISFCKLQKAQAQVWAKTIISLCHSGYLPYFEHGKSNRTTCVLCARCVCMLCVREHAKTRFSDISNFFSKTFNKKFSNSNTLAPHNPNKQLAHIATNNRLNPRDWQNPIITLFFKKFFFSPIQFFLLNLSFNRCQTWHTNSIDIKHYTNYIYIKIRSNSVFFYQVYYINQAL